MNSNVDTSIVLTKKNAFFICNMGIGDMIVTAGIIEYLSTVYDIVIVVCRTEHIKYLRFFHHNNEKIRVHVYKMSYMSNGLWTFPKEIISSYEKNADIYSAGQYSPSGKMLLFPNSFYTDCNIPLKNITKNINVTAPQNIQNDVHLLQSFGHYIVVQQQCSTGFINLINRFKIDIDALPVIDVNNNLYTPNHKFYDIANKFINLENPLWYSYLLKNATEIYLVDSCIHALTFLLDLSHVKIKVCASRAYDMKYLKHNFDYVQLCAVRHQNGLIEHKFPEEIMRSGNY